MKPPKNACPICDALGKSGPCEGHGASASNSEDNEKTDEREELIKTNTSSVAFIMVSLALQAPHLDEVNNIACFVEHPAILNIDMDIKNLQMTFTRNTLSPEVFQSIASLLQNAIGELSDVNIDVSDNTIIINAMSPKAFNHAVIQLMQQNLLPKLQLPTITEPKPTKGVTEKVEDRVKSNSVEPPLEESSSNTAPTPFATSFTPTANSGSE